MLELLFRNKSIGTLRDPDPRQIKSILHSFTGQPQLQPLIPTRTLDDGGWAVIQWDETMQGYRQIARLVPQEA
jgi:hypothetical protein